MSDRYPILRSLDPYHARIGYLGALALVGVRSIDTQAALAARYQNMLFDKVYQDDARFDLLRARIPAYRLSELEERFLRTQSEDPSAVFTDTAPVEVERPPADWMIDASQRRPQPRRVRSTWLYTSEFWLLDGNMPSTVGLLPREKVDRTIDLARWTGVLLPTLELSETGYLLQHLLGQAKSKAPLPDLFNPIDARAHPCLPVLYFRILLEHEMLYPYLVIELVERQDSGRPLATRGKDGLLLAAARRLMKVIGEARDPEDVLSIRDADRFTESIEKKDSTQENYLRPRMEILVDLGMLDRRSTSTGGRQEFVWQVNDTTRRLARELAQFTSSPQGLASHLERYLDRAFFGSMAAVSSVTTRRVESHPERMLWVARAFERIGREFGFTPGRTLALKACLMAWENGQTLEVGDAFDAVYEAARKGSPVLQYLHFSGGSRFDREFLIRIDPELTPLLEDLISRRGT
jgi:hypothetical protein